MAASAAFFDLDRTLIKGSSAPVFSRCLAAEGMGSDSIATVMNAYYSIYERFGEDPITMQAARLAARQAKGWPITKVASAVEAAADEIADMVEPYVPQLFEEHREAGRLLVLATTTPVPFVGPLADRLGLDGVVATHWKMEDGVFTGELDGPFTWGRQKRNAVKAWAAEHRVDLGSSYAYSDSAFDAPLLDAVGHPVAVNPDARLWMIARLRGWPIRDLDVPEGVVKILGRELQRFGQPFAKPFLVPNAKFRITGTDNIPEEGGALVCANHRSYFDPVVMSLVLASTGRPVRGLGKKEVFDAPIIGQLARAVGGIRVDRGTGSDEPLHEAEKALRAGEMVMLMPEGTIPRGPAFYDPELKGRWGAARLATATGVPVVPIGLWGTEKVWPRSARLPRLSPFDRPEIIVNVGEPIYLTGDDLDAETKKLMTAIADLLPPEARQRREPTDAELALTYPPGYTGDPRAEADRRPGSDT